MRTPYIVTAAAVLSTVFLAVVFIASQSARLDLTLLGETAGLDAPQQTTQFVYDDPLITIVPEDQQAPAQKTKVFVSSEDPLLGNTAAKVFVIFYGSLLDSTMQGYLNSVEQLEDALGDDLAVVWKDNTTNAVDIEAATVAHCADSVGKFWQYVKALPNTEDQSLTGYKNVAVEVGVNTTELEDCLSANAYSAQIAQSTALAQTLDVNGGHTVFINDTLYNQPVSIDSIIQAAKEALTTN